VSPLSFYLGYPIISRITFHSPKLSADPSRLSSTSRDLIQGPLGSDPNEHEAPLQAIERADSAVQVDHDAGSQLDA
jgi:hypothetical protein